MNNFEKILDLFQNSKYGSESARILKQLPKSNFQKQLYIERLTKIVKYARVHSSDIVECASLVHPDFCAVDKLGSGKFGITFLMQNIGAEKKLHVFKVAIHGEFDTLNPEVMIQNTIGKRNEHIAEMYGVVSVEVDGEKTKALDMEYIKGKTLRQILKDGALVPETAVNYGLQILEGLSYLHRQNIYHRDLRPENIMITDDGVVKLIDFGLATSKQIATQPKMNRLYAAPEFRIDAEYDNSDLWSFGLVFYEMLSGEHLIKPSEKDVYDSLERFKDYVADKEKIWATVQREIDEKYKNRIKSKVPEELQETISKCLKVDSSDRYQFIDKLVNNIEAAQVLLRKSSMEKARRDYAARTTGHGTAVETYRDPILRRKSRKLFEPIKPDGTALDIGCGQGDASTCLQEEKEIDGKKVWLPSVAEIRYVDITSSMVDKGIIDGKIKGSEFVAPVDASERLPYSNNIFDYIITRYFIHDLNREEKKYLFHDVKGMLKLGGKFQIIDMVADSEESQAFYNLYHSQKTRGPYRQCWIPTETIYHKLFSEGGFSDVITDTYTSHVNTQHWLREEQITPDRLENLNRLFKDEIKKNGHTKEYFNLRESKEGNILVDFPVLLICGTKAR